ncbi:TPA: hypothetical protein OL873_003924 [Klebsiella pneumoniae]|uniref:hypothetical protein n=1 Tax=Klebsiella pneumoniae complex TaxID=3390273 RepID=UPI000651E665|nr:MULTISPECIES: hypothetical protein [Klebsiella]AOM91418.1 hypothetical protein AM275_18400 [Klebsiella pneumoniae]AOM95214.1 hypothetical protein AM277_11450 [Klebsiella pneumoniae]AON01270.1 hypothetical protein AM278_13620 [Klebsiella pneumoniae]EIW8845644.1 hypothetical protein [Klebsiella pneumoniae]EIW8871054.1 hypothetical protein [Klebsiella pneumoniae]
MNNDGLTLNQLAERNAALVTDVEKLRAERDRLAAENMAMIRLLTDISDNHVEYLSEGEGTMFAGVPLDYVSEINMYVSRDVNAENPFPATDRILAAVEARGVEKAIAHLEKKFSNIGVQIMNLQWLADSLREGADK